MAEVLGAQGNNGKATICDRCFASVKSGSEFCPECGAPIGNSPAEGSDAAIYPELARANLLRMRGDYAAALDQCRSILRKFPNNVSANQLLGDICSETSDFEQAKEWYELALDISPDSEPIRRKLEAVRQRLEHHETEGLVEQLGLPPTKSKSGYLALGLAALVVGVGVVAYFIGANMRKETSPGPKRTTVSAAQENPSTTTPTNEGNGTSQPTSTPPTTQTPVDTSTGSAEDRSLAQLIGQRSTAGAKLLDVAQDPRSGLLVLTYRVEDGEDEKVTGATLASTAFDVSPNTRVLTIRAIRKDALVYVADAHRGAYEETKTETWKSQNGAEPAAIAKHMLTQEWTPNGAATPPTSTEQAPVSQPGT